jgi:hypothetical protein
MLGLGKLEAEDHRAFSDKNILYPIYIYIYIYIFVYETICTVFIMHIQSVFKTVGISTSLTRDCFNILIPGKET